MTSSIQIPDLSQYISLCVQMAGLHNPCIVNIWHRQYLAPDFPDLAQSTPTCPRRESCSKCISCTPLNERFFANLSPRVITHEWKRELRSYRCQIDTVVQIPGLCSHRCCVNNILIFTTGDPGSSIHGVGFSFPLFLRYPWSTHRSYLHGL